MSLSNSGPSEDQKAQLAQKIVESLVAALDSKEKSISVAIEEVSRDDWTAQVYQPDIAPSLERLYKKPGYAP